MSVLEITSDELDGILGIDRRDPSEKAKKKASKPKKTAGTTDPNEVDLEVEGNGQKPSKAKKSKKTKAKKRNDMTAEQKKMLDPSYAGDLADDELEFLTAQLNASSALRKKWGIVGNVTTKKIRKRISQNA